MSIISYVAVIRPVIDPPSVFANDCSFVIDPFDLFFSDLGGPFVRTVS